MLVDGKPVDACVYLMRRSNGATIETIDGLAQPDGDAPPDSGGVPRPRRGAVRVLHPRDDHGDEGAAREQTPHPTEDEIREGLKDNICRCTGFMPIFDAVAKAAEWLEDEDAYDEWKPKYGPMGTSSVLLDGFDSVQGKLAYADDLTMEGHARGQGRLGGAPVRAHPLARHEQGRRRRRACTASSRTRTCPGLNAHGRTVPDQPVFAFDIVRFTGDPICLVLADTREQAEEAAKLVKVEYEVLPGLFDPRDSLKDDAPQLVESSPGNVCKALTHIVGDVDAAHRALRRTSSRATSRRSARITRTSSRSRHSRTSTRTAS